MSLCWWFGLSLGQDNTTAMSAHCHKSVPIHMTLDIARTTNNHQACTLSFFFNLFVSSCEGACFQCWTVVVNVMVHAQVLVPIWYLGRPPAFI